MTKFKVGDRVRATNPHHYIFGHIHTVEKVLRDEHADADERDRYLLTGDSQNSEWFDRELELVTTNEEGQQPVGRKTYKQLQDSVTVKKGALWQEACDDGDQEYVLLDESFNKDSRNTQRIYDRSLVEEDSKHFVEVFKVEPQYMTREELDKWEAFKGRKKPGRKVKVSYSPGATDMATIMKMVDGVHKRLPTDTAKTGRTWTPAQRRAQSRKIKAAWAAKKASK